MATGGATQGGGSRAWRGFSAALFFCATIGAASADTAPPFIAPDSPPAYLPDGSTWVPRRDGLGTAGDESGPQTVGTLCMPNVGSPTTAPSQLDGAVSPSTGIIVSGEGYMTFDRSNPAGCASTSFTGWASLFGVASATYSEPRVIYDSYAGKFVIAIIVKDVPNSISSVYAAASSDGTTWTTHLISSETLPYVKQDLSLGYDSSHWLVAVDYTTASNLKTEYIAIDKTTMTLASAFSSVPAPHSVAPIVLDGSTTDYFLAADTTAKNRITRVTVDFGASLSGTWIAVTPFDLPPTISESSGGTLLPDDGNFHAPTIQIGNSLWNAHTIRVDGHARVRMYKLPTNGASPAMTFTPVIVGNEDLFAPSVATNLEAAGSTAFLTATYNNFDTPGSPLTLLTFEGPNDATTGWTYDVVAANSSFTASGAPWSSHSATVMNPTETSAWAFGQLASGGAATNWSIAGAQIRAPGAPFAAPIASAATGIDSDHFTANWSAVSASAANSGASPSAAPGYAIDVATNSAFTGFVSGYQNKNVGNVTSVGITGLSATTTYYYRVRVAGAVLSSNTIDATTKSAVVAVGPLELLALSLLAFGGLGLRRRFA